MSNILAGFNGTEFSYFLIQASMSLRIAEGQRGHCFSVVFQFSKFLPIEKNIVFKEEDKMKNMLNLTKTFYESY